MDCLIDTNHNDITPMMSKLKLIFSIDAINSTMKLVELTYWDYLDNYRQKNKHRYPYIPINLFLLKLMNYHKSNCYDIRNVNTYCKAYESYKKTLPTAGVLLHCKDHFVVIRMKTAKIWSMPKGKQDNLETSEQTAIREFMEETGIDLGHLITPTSLHMNILKTVFYIVEADSMSNKFHGYNTNEIGDVKWVSIVDILDNTKHYSKQVTQAAEILLTQLQ